MNYQNMPQPPNMGYPPGAMGPPGQMDHHHPGGINSQPFVNGGGGPHMPGGHPQPFDPAHQELLAKYKKLKSKYFEVDGKCKDMLAQLERARGQNIRLKEEKTGLLDRVVELEAILAQQLPPGAVPPPSSAFSRGFAYSRPPMLDLNGFARVMDEDDDEVDPRKASRHVGTIAIQRKQDEEELRREDSQRRASARRPRNAPRNLLVQPVSTMAYAYGPPPTPGSMDELYAAQQGYAGMDIDPAIAGTVLPPPPMQHMPPPPLVATATPKTRGKGKRAAHQQQQPPPPPPQDEQTAQVQYPSYPDHPRQLASGIRESPGQQQQGDGAYEGYPHSRSGSPISPVSGSQSQAQDSKEETTPARSTRSKRQKTQSTPKYITIPSVPRGETGAPVLPLVAGIVTVFNLGEVSTKETFHSERHIYPVGYEIQRRYPSTVDPVSDAMYTCKILDGGDTPTFQITASDQPDRPVVANTATGAWSAIVRAANALRDRNHSNSISGPDYFGLSQPTVKHLIQELPGANELPNYVWINYVEGGP